MNGGEFWHESCEQNCTSEAACDQTLRKSPQTLGDGSLMFYTHTREFPLFSTRKHLLNVAICTTTGQMPSVRADAN